MRRLHAQTPRPPTRPRRRRRPRGSPGRRAGAGPRARRAAACTIVTEKVGGKRATILVRHALPRARDRQAVRAGPAGPRDDAPARASTIVSQDPSTVRPGRPRARCSPATRRRARVRSRSAPPSGGRWSRPRATIQVVPSNVARPRSRGRSVRSMQRPPQGARLRDRRSTASSTGARRAPSWRSARSPAWRAPPSPIRPSSGACLAAKGHVQGPLPAARPPRRGRPRPPGARADRRRRQGRAHLPDLLGQAGDADDPRASSASTARTRARTPRAWSTPSTSSAATRSTATRRPDLPGQPRLPADADPRRGPHLQLDPTGRPIDVDYLHGRPPKARETLDRRAAGARARDRRGDADERRDGAVLRRRQAGDPAPGGLRGARRARRRAARARGARPPSAA